MILDGIPARRCRFDAERAAKRFYRRFSAERAAFLSSIEGIPDDGTRRQYAPVVLNRLIFIYFVQKKGFLDDDPSYLRSKLEQSKQLGRDLFYSGFLCPLFFEGFAKKQSQRSREINRLLGRVPHLGGGLFRHHQIEETHGVSIQIADAAFEKLFDFFDDYQWRLDEHPLQADEIDPDALGYTFEKHVNQRQMGAYYTKGDVAEYIARNTVIPRLFDMAQQNCRSSPEAQRTIWRLLQATPGRYICSAVKKGAELPLPPEIAAGMDDIPKRVEWNKPSPEEYGLPAEIWREVVARRRRYEEAKARLAAGEVQSIDDLITYNLDIRQFALDAVESCESPNLLRAFYHTVEQVTVLDPTCGSGAFLLAALDILAPLYEACLHRMEAFLRGQARSDEDPCPDILDDFREILQRVDEHPNCHYFIVKSIIANNLFGVDIMEGAVEMCKLRLLLKLVAQVERAEDIEPLPDMDFNIRCGNALVGHTTYDEAKSPTYEKWTASCQPFHWLIEFSSILARGGFDVVIGNPPYVEYSKVRQDYILHGYETESCGNLYAFLVERSLNICCGEGRYGLIVQLSSVSTRNMTPLHTFVRRRSSTLYISCFAERPQQLFAGVCIPLAILIGKKGTTGSEQCRTLTTGVYRWHESERDSLFQRVFYCPHPDTMENSLFYVPKIGSALELAICEKFFRHDPISKRRAFSRNGNNIHYRTAGGRYWKIILNFSFENESTANKIASLEPELPALAATAVLSSNLFWWYYTISFDIYNLKDYVLFDFRFDCDGALPRMLQELARLGEQLMDDYRKNANERKVFIKSKQQYATYREYLPRLSKPIIDAIDRVLAQHYGFTDEELDFIVNYDVKYRMSFVGVH